MKILMVYPEFPTTFWSFKYAIEFINKKATNPPLGLLTVAAMLPPEWEVRLIDMNVSKLTDIDILTADFIFLSAMDVQRSSAKSIISRVKALHKPVICGGPLFTQEYNDFSNVDHFILNEAEITLPRFLSDLQAGIPKPIYQTDQYPDIQQTPIPRWDLLDIKAYDAMSVQFSRGCPFNCEFCNVTALLGHRPRTKSAPQLIAELDSLYKIGWRRNIFLVDDNFIGNKKILKQEILPALIEWRKGKIGCLFITEASINLADDPELIQMMVDAGFINVFLGIETPDEESLTECHKLQNTGINLINSVKILQRSGLQVMAGFIVGFDHDSPTIFQRQIKFIQDSGIVTAMVGLLQAPLGTKLYDRLLKEGRITNEMTGDNADGTTNILPRMDAGVLHEGYRYIIQQIFSTNLLYARIKTFLSEYHPKKDVVTLAPEEIAAFLRSILYLGILGKDRKEYWGLILWSILHRIDLFPLAITLTIYGYHFQKMREKMMVPADVQLKDPGLNFQRTTLVSAP